MKKLDPSLLKQNVTKRITADIAAQHISGASVRVTQAGEELFRAHYGWADSDNLTPMDEDCLFRIASMSKPISTVAALILMERGLIDLEAPVETYLPAFAALCHGRVDEKGNVIRGEKLQTKITVKHLLTHTSLIDFGAPFTAQEANMTAEEKASLAGALDFYSRLVVENEPGTRSAYSGTVAFDLLGGIIETVSGKKLDDFIREEVTAPLRMTDTTFTPTDQQWSRLVQMHDRKDGHSVRGATYDGCVFETYPVTHLMAGAGLISSLNDYDRFARMLLNNGSLDGVKILSENSVKMMQTPQVPPFENDRWGLGVRVIDNDRKILPIGCFGWSGAYGSHFWVDPVNQITAVYMKNSRYDGGSGAQTARNFETDIMASFAD